MFEWMTERARNSILQAHNEARERGREKLGTDHLLIGLLRDGENLAAGVLADENIGVERIREYASGLPEELTPEGVNVREGQAEGQIPFTTMAKTALEGVLREAQSLRYSYIGPEHILLSLERASGSRAQQILLQFAEAGRIRDEVIRRISGKPPARPMRSGIRTSVEKDAVDHPDNYGGAENPYEAIKVIEAWGLDFCLGNSVKYISRAGKKDPERGIEDLRKAAWYLNRRIEQLENGVE